MSTRLPKAFSDRMNSSLGIEYGLFENTLQGAPLTSIRINPQKSTDLSHLPINGKVPWNTDGRYLSDRPIFTLDPSFHGGAYYVQEASSMSIIPVIKQWIDTNNRPLRILGPMCRPRRKDDGSINLRSRSLDCRQ